MSESNSIAIPPKIENLIGKKFGHMEVMSYIGKIKRSHSGYIHYWLCRCDCGVTKRAISWSLKQGLIKSCGCKKSELMRKTLGPRKRIADNPAYGCWTSMKARCYDKNHMHYRNYGGRGIVVCERWINSFANFLADMGDRPSDKHSIDRFPDKNGNYEPGNCRWATAREQGSNMRTNVIIDFRGKSLTIIEWSRSLGIGYTTIRERIRRGWSIEKVFTHPVGPRVKKGTLPPV